MSVDDIWKMLWFHISDVWFSRSLERKLQLFNFSIFLSHLSSSTLIRQPHRPWSKLTKRVSANLGCLKWKLAAWKFELSLNFAILGELH